MDPEIEPIARPMVIELIDAAISAVRMPEEVLLEGVTWQVALDEFWVVGGRPGSGKSDLLVTAAGLQRPVSGTHRLFGDDVSRLKEKELLDQRLRLGVIFEMGGRLFGSLTVAENIGLPLRYHRNCSEEEVAERVSQTLELTGLASFAHNMPSQIARPWHSRVGLARALTLSPEVLLLDNPLAGLPPSHVQWWLDFLCKLYKGHEFFGGQRMTLVVTCNDLRPWLDRADRFTLVDHKQLVRFDDRAALERANEPLIRELLAEQLS